MKETGIIMSGNHPGLILDGTKTQTRRLWGLGKINANPDSWFGIPENVEGNLWRFFNKDGTTLIVKCPYGQVGGGLWVRETWAIAEPPLQNEFGNVINGSLKGYGIEYLKACELIHKATADDVELYEWRPSIHMPRWASRILLEITDIRVERLQEITLGDIAREGITLNITEEFTTPLAKFINLWDSLNAKRKPTKYDREHGITKLITPSYAWETNPWVWVISFMRLK